MRTSNRAPRTSPEILNGGRGGSTLRRSALGDQPSRRKSRRKSQLKAKPVGDVERLLARPEISPGARYEIKLGIDLYFGAALNLGPDTAVAFADETRVRAENRFIVTKTKQDLRDLPPVSLMHEMHKAAVALSDLVNGIGVDRVVSIFVRTEHSLPDDQARDRLERMLADLDDFASRLTAAQSWRRDRKTDRAKHFVRTVASIIERDKGQPIKRSKNKGSPFELLKDIAAVVGIGPGTVEETVRARRRLAPWGNSSEDAE
jgi:hypothetical protein